MRARSSELSQAEKKAIKEEIAHLRMLLKRKEIQETLAQSGWDEAEDRERVLRGALRKIAAFTTVTIPTEKRLEVIHEMDDIARAALRPRTSDPS